MSVLIPGMEMPTSCFECKLLDYTDTFKCRFRFESLTKEHGINISRPDWCPLIPIPEHGRLIDADALFKEIGMDGRFGILEAMCIQSIIHDAPTIIPADGKDTNVPARKEGET